MPQAQKNSPKEADTLLGRLKSGIQRRASIDGTPPAGGESIIRLLLDTYQQSRIAGDLLKTIISLKETHLAAYDQLPIPQQLAAALLSLETPPLEAPNFLEITGCPAPFSETVGVLTDAIPLRSGGYAYEIIVLDEESYPSHICCYARIYTPSCQRGARILVWEGRGYKELDLNDYTYTAYTSLAARALAHISTHRTAQAVSFSDAVNGDFPDAPNTVPPPDNRYDELIKAVLRGEVQCARADVPMHLIKPHDVDFALSFPLAHIERNCALIEKAYDLIPVIYWNNDHFVMSDDYGPYLAYRKLNRAVIPAIILGSAPPHAAAVKERGGADLLPPLLGFSRASESPPETKESLLDLRLSQRTDSDALRPIYNFFTELSSTIQTPGATERAVHLLLQSNPISLSAYGVRTRSEVVLGEEYRVDLMIESEELGQRRVLLVELESPTRQIFTWKGRPKAEITHALQQVEDWLRWWHEHPTRLPTGVDSTFPVDAVVVAGRSSRMTLDEKRRLTRLNQNRKVQLLTYDELLDRLKGLILSLNRNRRP